MSPVPNFIFPLLIGAFTAVSYVGFVIVYTEQPTPFIDEVFHIPQAQKYCDGQFREWDPKITTPPGLYLFSIGMLGPMSWVFGRQLCDVFCLRLTNLVAATAIFSTMYKLLIYLHGERVDNWKLMLAALNLSLTPVLYWFTFLYYTDVLSTLLVLLMILLHLHNSPTVAAFMGVVAVVMRQTNVVWVAFLGGIIMIESLGFQALKAPVSTIADVKILLRKIKRMSFSKPQRLAEIVANAVVDSFGYIIVVCSFILFVISNGGIVLGDKSAHTVSLHFTQMAYFSLFFLFFSLPYAVKQVKPFIKSCKTHPNAFLAILAFGLATVHYNTLVHPYLLADNRHYIFYLWNRLYGNYEIFKYLMVPIYMFGFYLIGLFIQGRSFPFQLLYFLCVAAIVVPQKLLELRYFILPFLIARTQSICTSWFQLLVEFVYNVLLNVITIYIFINKTFEWEDLPGLQRIIW